MNATTLHPRKLTLFASLSLADLGLTWLLLRHSDGQVYEANPIANWWLSTFGWSGLALFKAVAVLLAGGLCLAISRYRPRAGGRLLVLSCALLAGVVLYSCSLAGYVSGQGPSDAAELNRQRSRRNHLNSKYEHSAAYRKALLRLGEDLMARRLRLPEAVALLARTEMGRDPRWLRSLRVKFGNYSDQELLAINLIYHLMMGERGGPSQTGEIAKRLDDELENASGRSLEQLGVRLPLTSDGPGAAL